MKSMPRDTGIGIGIICIGFFFLNMAWAIDADPNDPVGPKLAPTIVAVLIVGLGVLQLAVGFFRSYQTTGAYGNPGEPVRPAMLAAVTSTGVAYNFMLPLIGYFFSTTIVLIAMLLIFGNRPNWRFLAIVIIGAGVYHIMFIELMGIHDPGGVFDLGMVFGF